MLRIRSILKSLKIKSSNQGGCCGPWVGQKENLLTSFNPHNGSSIAEVHCVNEEDYEAILQQAEEAFSSWRNVPAPKRGELIRAMADALRQHKDALGSLVSLEMGKSKQEGDGEVQEMIDIADFAVGQSRMLYGKTMHSERPKHRMYEQWHPLGVVGVISAFNFPVAVWAWNAFIAAICGNVVLWKPSPKTPLCAIAVQHICNEVCQEAGVKGIFNLFISDNVSLAKKMVADKRLPLISFTGSSHVGAQVAATVAQRFGKSILELSGNNAIILDATADFEVAIPGIVFGAVGTAGQRCTSTRRLFIERPVFDDVITTLVNYYKQLKVGDPLDEKNHMGPLIDAQSVESFQRNINSLQEKGAKILAGGQAIEGKGYYVQPTIVIAENDWPEVQSETFAPILYIMPYDNLDAAIALQNAVPQGLSSAFFTQRLQAAEQFLSCQGSDCGIANINIGTSGAEIGGAFGGEKETGGGRESGSDAWKAYMRRQTNTINWGAELPLAQGIQFKL